MQPIARMCHSMWWAFAAAGVIAFVAAAAIALQVASASVAVGVWQFAAGVLLVGAARRAPGGFAAAVPFLGAAVGGLFLGAAGMLFQAPEPRISLIPIGIWSVLVGAGFRAVAQIARAKGVPDGGLYPISWIAIGMGAAVSTLPAWGLGNFVLLAAAATTVTGAVTVAGALRLRVMPEEAPPAISNREARRRDRPAPGR
jgi:hypothetical protein